jgi:uncharacterized membrane protein YjjB (DUF3815 family)
VTIDVFALLADAFWSALAALGFAMLFNVPTRTLLGCAICGATGHALRTLLMQVGLSIELSTLAGATAVGFLGWVFARRWQTPATTFAVTGAIPLAPGVFAFRTMLGLINVATAPDIDAGTVALVEASINGVKTALILGAIAAGIAAPSLLFERRKPIR